MTHRGQTHFPWMSALNLQLISLQIQTQFCLMGTSDVGLRQLVQHLTRNGENTLDLVLTRGVETSDPVVSLYFFI